jgi:hypothetical protein
MDNKMTLDKDDKDLSEQLEELRRGAMLMFEQAEEGWSQWRIQAVDDYSFCNGKQWDDNLLQIARMRKEPTLQVNRLPTFVKQVENELRQREMAVTISATDEAGSEDTANIFTGIIRGIEARSNAKAHYIYAAGENGALVPGVGYIVIDVDYCGKSFEQDISIRSIKDPMKVLPDPAVLEADFSDAEYWFVFDDYTESTFKKLYPRAECKSVDMFPTMSSKSSWLGDKVIRVARFWYKEYETRTSYLYENGDIEIESKLETFDEETEDGDVVEYTLDKKKGKRPILRSRQVLKTNIKWMDFTAAETLDEGEWAGEMFPIVAVTGPMTIIDGRRDIRGIVRFAKESQQMLNYLASSTARRIASANKTPWLVTKEAINGHEAAWRTMNTDGKPYVLWNAIDAKGNPTQAPIRADQTGQINDLLQAAAKFEEDVKATIGIYDAGLGATPNEQSGVAIKTLAQQGQNANYHFSDNLVTSLKRVGDILLDLIPKIYDTPRALKSITPDGQGQIVKINQIFDKKGEQKKYDIAGAAGHYGVSVNVGPAYATTKQAAIASLTTLMQTYPNAAPALFDLVVRNMDFNGKEIAAERMLKLLAQTNPGLVESPDQADIPPQAQAAMVQQNQVIQTLTQELQLLTEEHAKLVQQVQSKQIDHELEMEKIAAQTQSQASLSDKQAENDIKVAAARATSDAVIAEKNLEMTSIKAQLAHTEKMMQLTMSAIKQFGTNADEVIQDVMPTIDAVSDAAASSQPLNSTTMEQGASQ